MYSLQLYGLIYKYLKSLWTIKYLVIKLDSFKKHLNIDNTGKYYFSVKNNYGKMRGKLYFFLLKVLYFLQFKKSTFIKFYTST